MRWTAPADFPAGRIGFFGVATPLGNGTARVRNLRVSTRSALPAPGPKSARYDFSTTPGGARQVGGAQRNVACPSFAGAAGCDAGECPAAGARCAEIETQAGIFPKATMGLSLPVGLDPEQPWSVRFRFAAVNVTDGGTAAPRVLGSDQGALIEPTPGGPEWSGNLHGLDQNLGPPLRQDRWHRIDLTFQPQRGEFELRFDGASQTFFGFPPANWSPHLGTLWLGNNGLYWGRIHGYWTDVEITQP